MSQYLGSEIGNNGYFNVGRSHFSSQLHATHSMVSVYNGSIDIPGVHAQEKGLQICSIFRGFLVFSEYKIGLLVLFFPKASHYIFSLFTVWENAANCGFMRSQKFANFFSIFFEIDFSRFSCYLKKNLFWGGELITVSLNQGRS